MNTDIGALGGADPHDVLGVRPGASRQQVAQAFHREALRGGHPDTGGDAHAFRRLLVARDALLQVQTSPAAATSAMPPAGPHATDVTRHPPQGHRPARPAPASSATSVLPLVLLLFLFFIGIPAILRAIMLVAVP